MISLAARAHGGDAGALASRIGVPREAVELVWASEVIDLHLETFIPPRLWGYDIHARHGAFPPTAEPGGTFGGRLFGHLDFPRAIEGGLTGAMWSIATNVTRVPSSRREHLAANVRALADSIERHPGMRAVRTFADWKAARAAGEHGALVTVQGGNAFEGEGTFHNPGGLVSRVTVVHLSNSSFGDTSSPLRLGTERGLTRAGASFVRWLDDERIFVDLSHASPKTFWDMVAAHDRTLPLICTHTGASAAHPMWRNVDDRQIAAVADSGGVLGVIVHGAFLGPNAKDGRAVIDHLEAFIRAGGEGCAAIGTDFDGFIVPPRDLRDGATAYYRLTGYMLERGWSEAKIRGVLGENFLRSFAALRP